MTGLDVTIAVCTYNRADYLRRALASLLELHAPCSYEILIVDNASTDHTGRVIAQNLRRRRPPVRSVVEPQQGIAFARNRAVAEARGQWIAFFDDDQVAQRDWLLELLATARRRNARCVGGRVLLILSERQRAALTTGRRRLLGELGDRGGEQRYTRRWTPGTGNLLLHRSIFDEVGTFDESLSEGGEDTDLYRRLRAAEIDAWFNPKAVVYHHVPGYRLQDKYLLWSARRKGWHNARGDRGRWGKAMFPMIYAARLAQAMLLFVLRLLREDPLGARWVLCRGVGYLSSGLCLMAPQLFPEEQSLSSLNFRLEREKFPLPEDGRMPGVGEQETLITVGRQRA
jgi:GT2 family glycosyltransferase